MKYAFLACSLAETRTFRDRQMTGGGGHVTMDRTKMNKTKSKNCFTGRRMMMGTAAALLAGSVLLFGLAASATESETSASISHAPAAAGTFVTAYANILKNVEYSLTPESVTVTSDGGYIALALTDSPEGFLKNWLLKLDASGRPLWQREVGCASGAPGDYGLGVSAQQLSDGGYILGGGILGCGGPFFQRALVEKIDARGRVVWSFAYPAGTADGTITKIKIGRASGRERV